MNLLGIILITAIAWWIGGAFYRIVMEDDEY